MGYLGHLPLENIPSTYLHFAPPRIIHFFMIGHKFKLVKKKLLNDMTENGLQDVISHRFLLLGDRDCLSRQ